MGVWTDSALYGAQGEVLEDPHLEGYDRLKIYSQAGALVGFIDSTKLDTAEDVSLSIMDWRSKSSPRVFQSTFAAEAGVAF